MQKTVFSSQKITLNDNDGFVVRAVLYDTSNATFTPTAILLPDKLRQISNTNYGDATITNVTSVKSDDYPTFSITLTATKIVPILWLDIQQSVKDKYNLQYWFTDNAFTMTEPTVTVELKIISSNGTVNLNVSDLRVFSIKKDANQNSSTPKPTEKSNASISNIKISIYSLIELIIILIIEKLKI